MLMRSALRAGRWPQAARAFSYNRNAAAKGPAKMVTKMSDLSKPQVKQKPSRRQPSQRPAAGVPSRRSRWRVSEGRV